MSEKTDGARQLPLRHISIRVPWNDTDWSGHVCQKPAENIACLILQNIRKNRNDANENEIAGQSWEDLEQAQLPPCVSERGSFMSPFEIVRKLQHPYAGKSNAHNHLQPTPFRHPPYSAACLPFRWMLKEKAHEIIKEMELGFNQDIEDRAHQLMGYETEWVQEKANQLALLDTFFSAIKPEQSLALFYAKRTPLSDDTRRVVIGVGQVTHVGNPVEYLYSGEGVLRSVLWERSIQHSVRPDFKHGFIMPYHQVMEYLQDHPEEDPEQYIAYVPDDQFWAFSYGSEHVTNDGAIGVLLACAKALRNIQKIIPGPWDQVLKWVDTRINELWSMRGPCPGLGSTLSAFGIENGSLIAHELESLQAAEGKAGQDPWVLVEELFTNPTKFLPYIQQQVSTNLCKKWALLPDERKQFLKLLSRFELTKDQATRYYVHEDKQRSSLHVSVTDAEILANPYRLYELDRVAPDAIWLTLIDRGSFPDQSLREKYPLPEPSNVDDPVDDRRVRSFVIQQLEAAALNGDTLQQKSKVIQEIRELDVQPPCQVDGDLMNIVEAAFNPEIVQVSLTNGQPAYQLAKLAEIGKTIRSSVQRRINGNRHINQMNWRAQLDEVLGNLVTNNDQFEEEARQEKTAALQELFESRFSVLIGPAGTGKTTLLKVLCQEKSIQAGGILLLAPTGKARVRMETQTGIKGAKTIAQFLLPVDRYDTQTGRYRLSEQPAIEAGKTIIIDEASMLTEDQLGAVLDALKGVERLILVGDPRQLPPIGTGRPFLDIVNTLAPGNVESIFPKIGKGYAELTIRRRQVGTNRDDLLLAEWFSGRPLDPGADEIWDQIQEDHTSEFLRFVRWENSEALQQKLLNVMVEELKLDSKDDSKKFEVSLGGLLYGEGVFFWESREGKPGACYKAENWQILSPMRNLPHGVEALNRLMQSQFRKKTKEFATQKWRKIPRPMGREEILYGDKVIQTQNQRRHNVWPKETALQYVANGEIGIAVGQFKGKNANYKGLPWQLDVEFSSQPGFKYGYWGKDFGEEANPVLELAYALTIHKTQGSEFGLTFVIIPNPCRLLSRELLYTALTRQKNRIVIFHQGDRHDLRKFSGDYYSETAHRLTNLFHPSNPVALQDRFLEEDLIHKTRHGESVRSKSEVIIANLLHDAGIDYAYELSFIGSDGKKRLPDFTIEDSETGQLILWEHLGMLKDPGYRERWKNKLNWYQNQGIIPLENGGGNRGTLVITKDDERGGIDSEQIEKIIQGLFCL